jgi:hypothetical protein
LRPSHSAACTAGRSIEEEKEEVQDNFYLLEQKRILEDSLNGLNQVRLEGGGVLLTPVARRQELLQGLILVA